MARPLFERPRRVATADTFTSHLVEVGDDLVEQPQTLHSLVVGLQLHVELGEVADGGEHDGDALARLVVELVVATLALQEVRGHVLREDVVEEAAVVRLQLLHLLLLLGGLGHRFICSVTNGLGRRELILLAISGDVWY